MSIPGYVRAFSNFTLASPFMFKNIGLRLLSIQKHLSPINPATTRQMSGPPTGLIATKGVEVIGYPTPSGHKVTIMCEELKEAYGWNYTFQTLNIDDEHKTQKQPWYTALSPNGKIPVIVDHDRNDFAVFEGSAILTYLTRYYDPEHKFSFEDPDDISRAEQWMTFAQSSIGPIQGQAGHFYRLSKEKLPYPLQRYLGETERLYGVLNKRLEDRDYIVGPGRGKFSIADITNFSWVNVSYFCGIDIKQFPHLSAWVDRLNERVGVQKGLAVPFSHNLINSRYPDSVKNDPEFAKKEEELKENANKAKEQYGYKYTSP